MKLFRAAQSVLRPLRGRSCLAIGLCVGLLAGSARATIIERVVAVVGERPILLSELRSRARPFEQTLPQAGTERATAVSQLYSQMLDRMVDEELIERAATQAQVKVTPEEVEAAIGRVAKGNGVEVDKLLEEVERGGVSRSQYRIEIRRQLLDAKVMNLRLQGRLRISEEDVRREYEKLVQTERQRLEFRAVAVKIAVGKTAGEQRAAAELADDIARRARAGEDFGELSRTYSTDERLRASGGLMPTLRPADLPKAVRTSVTALQIGEVSAPIRWGGDLVVLRVIERDDAKVPSFEAANATISQRVQLQKMERARRSWLDGLRRRTHVEVRL